MINKKNQRTFIIGGLLAILALMAIGYAAFSSKLTISGTSNISSNWSVTITGIESSLSGATNASAPSFSGTTASFNTNLTSPGDSATYTITVNNSGSLDATLESININAGSNDAIIFEPSGINQGDSLLHGENEQLIVKVIYNPEVSTQPENLTSSITVTLNFTQLK